MMPSFSSRIAHKTFLPPFHEQEGPWWENLQADFHRQHETFDMPLGDRLRVKSTAAVDRVSNTMFSTLLSATVLTNGYGRDDLLGWLGESSQFVDAALTGDPKVFFRPPPTGVQVHHAPARGLYFRPKDGVCEALTFRSPYQPFNQKHAPHYLKYERNATARALYWRHKDGPRPTIIGVHGFNADPFLLNQVFFALPWFYSLGCDVLLFTMPFHGARAPRGSGFSGRHFFVGGPSQINEAMGQSICDLQVLVRHLHDDIGAPKTAVTGISLGGLTAALMASVEPRLSLAIPNVPVVSLGDLLLEWHPLAEIIKRRVRRSGHGLIELRKAFAAITPISYKPLLPKDRLMIIAGAADRMATPKHARLLCDHWGHCNMHWFPGNHVLHLDRGHYLREMARFMNRVGFLEDSRAPARSWVKRFGPWRKSA